MSYLGARQVDQTLTFAVNTHAPDTGEAADAASPPTWRCYENDTGTPILTGTMSLLDGSNTVGLYSGTITISAANGFEINKSYIIRITGTVNGVTGATTLTFQVVAAPATEAQAADIQSRLPAALVSGRINANVGAMAADSLTAAALAADAVAEINATVDTAIGDAALATSVNLGALSTVIDSILASLIPVIRKSTAQAGAASTVTLDTGASATDDIYNGNWVILTGGTGAGQTRLIIDYAGSTRIASVAPAWAIAPSGTTTFAIVPAAYMQGALALSANAVNAAALAADAVAEIQSGLATSVALAVVDGNVDTLVSSVTTVEAIQEGLATEAQATDIQSRLPAALVGGRMDSNVSAIDNNVSAAVKLALSAQSIGSGSAVSGTLSATQMTTDLTQTANDHWNGRVLIFISGNLALQGTTITDYDGTTKMLTFTAVTQAPAAGDDFVIL